jgi:hypothetical protein
MDQKLRLVIGYLQFGRQVRTGLHEQQALVTWILALRPGQSHLL